MKTEQNVDQVVNSSTKFQAQTRSKFIRYSERGRHTFLENVFFTLDTFAKFFLREGQCTKFFLTCASDSL